MEKLFFATYNQHKLQEAANILQGVCILHTPQELGIYSVPEETEQTLEGNAILKAEALFSACNCPCFADDTGLLVDALNGAPGVYSARYAGENATDADNRAKLLQELSALTRPHKAHFATVIAYIDRNGKKWLFRGEVHGHIINEERGCKGFGYDAIFVPEGSNLTFAQMDSNEKNALSHRSQAIEKLKQHLIKEYSAQNQKQ